MVYAGIQVEQCERYDFHLVKTKSRLSHETYHCFQTNLS